MVRLLLLGGVAVGSGLSAETTQTGAQPLHVGEKVYLSPSPYCGDVDCDDIHLVIDLRYPYEGVYQELGRLRRQGIEVVNIPISSKGPTLEYVKALEEALTQAQKQSVLIHDSNGHRTAALWGAYQLWLGHSIESALDSVNPLDDSTELRKKLENFQLQLTNERANEKE